jgi:hypothetical protein
MKSQDLGKGIYLMNIKTLLFAILLGFSLPVAAEFTTVSLAHEVSLSNFRVPATLNSGVAFKKCDDCDIQRSRVTEGTQYIINGQPVPLKEFRKSVFKVRNRAGNTITVLQHLESNTVVSVSVTI